MSTGVRNDRLTHFLLDEVIPKVEQHRTPDGRPIILSSDPNDRATGGASTGAIGAFTVAWTILTHSAGSLAQSAHSWECAAANNITF
jgi:enterochelin esterase-like enzyme